MFQAGVNGQMLEKDVVEIEYRQGSLAYTAEEFVALAQRVWPRHYDLDKVAAALRSTINVGAWSGNRLVGSVRVLTDGYLFNTVPEVMVDPEYHRQGIGRELMRRALAAAPGGRLFFGAQPGNEPFFERCGFVRGPIGFVAG
jgi:GNAT superfamily N-acetyltransferase